MTILNIRVECWPGRDIKDACYELCTLANKLGIDAICEANGVTLIAIVGEGNPDALFANWSAAMKSKAAYKVVTSRQSGNP